MAWLNIHNIHRLTRLIAVGLSLYSLIYFADVLPRFGVFIFPRQHNALFLSGVLLLIFLSIPAHRGTSRGKLPWYDVLLILGSLVGLFYVVINYPLLLAVPMVTTPLQSILAIITLIAIAEAVRRTLGWPMLALAIIFFFYGLFSSHLPGMLRGPRIDFPQLLAYLYFSGDAFIGNLLGIGATLIMAFLLFAAFLQRAGAGDFFLNLALSLGGSLRGGPAKVAVVGSGLLGTMVGSTSANIGVTGSVTIPMMKRTGYTSHFAAAVEAVASTGGALMPPVMGVVAFIMADLSGLGYGAVVIGAILPAILYYIALYVQVDREAAKLGLRGLTKQELPSFGKTLKEGWYFFLPLIGLMVFLIPLHYDPVKASLYTLVILFVVSMFRKETRLGPRKILGALEDGPRMALSVIPILAILGVVTTGLTISNIMIGLGGKLIVIAGGSLPVLVMLTGVVCYLLGFGVSSIVAYIMLAVLMAPALIQMGVPILAAHMFIFYMGLTTFITPPNCPSVYMAAAIGEAPPFKTAWQAMRLGVVCFLVPFMFVFNPALLMIGTPTDIVLAAITSIIGVIALASGVEGYLFKETSWLERIALIGGGALLMIPGWVTDVIGVAILAVVWLRQRAALKKGL